MKKLSISLVVLLALTGVAVVVVKLTKAKPTPTALPAASPVTIVTPATASPSANPAELTQLKQELSTTSKQVYAAKIKYHDYYQLMQVRTRGQEAIILYAKNYPAINDSNLPALTADAKAEWEQLQARESALKEKIKELAS